MQEARFLLGGSPGEDVSTVDVADLKALRSIYCDMETRNPGKKGALGISIIRAVCSPGADIGAVWYRCAMLQTLEMRCGDLLARWKRSGDFDEAVFRVASTISMKWIEVGGPAFAVAFRCGCLYPRIAKRVSLKFSTTPQNACCNPAQAIDESRTLGGERVHQIRQIFALYHAYLLHAGDGIVTELQAFFSTPANQPSKREKWKGFCSRESTSTVARGVLSCVSPRSASTGIAGCATGAAAIRQASGDLIRVRLLMPRC